LAKQDFRRHFHHEGFEVRTIDIRRPNKIAPGDIEIALGGFAIIISATRGIQIRHDRRYNELPNTTNEDLKDLRPPFHKERG